MLVLLHPYLSHRKSCIKGKSLSKINTDDYYSTVDGRSLSLCNSYYRFTSSSINGKGYSK